MSEVKLLRAFSLLKRKTIKSKIDSIHSKYKAAQAPSNNNNNVTLFDNRLFT